MQNHELCLLTCPPRHGLSGLGETELICQLRKDNALLQQMLAQELGRTCYRADASYVWRCRNWLRPIAGQDLSVAYLALIDDLDYDSIACVDQVLYAIHAIARQELPHASAVRFVKLFSDEEAASITAMRAALMQRIVPLANGQCYAWQHYLLPIPAFEPGVFYYRHFADLAGSLAGVKDRDIIDAGAYVGDSALILQEYTAQLVYSFEAVPGHFQTLLKTLELNRCSRVIPICKALGAMPGMMSMKLNGPGSTLTTQHFSYRAERPELQVEVITLDDFAAAQHLDIGLIKTDIEGSEPDFLKGAEQTIRRCRPVLLLSMYHNHADFFGLKPLIESWNLGYRFKIAKPVESPYWDTMLICWPA